MRVSYLSLPFLHLYRRVSKGLPGLLRRGHLKPRDIILKSHLPFFSLTFNSHLSKIILLLDSAIVTDDPESSVQLSSDCFSGAPISFLHVFSSAPHCLPFSSALPFLHVLPSSVLPPPSNR